MTPAASLAMEPRDPLFRKMVALSAALHVLMFFISAAWVSLRVPPARITPVAVVDLVGGGQFAPAPPAAPAPDPPAAQERAKASAPRSRVRAERPPPAAKKAREASPRTAKAREVPPSAEREFSEKIRRMREERASGANVRQAVEQIQREKAIRSAVRGIGERVAHRVDLSGVRAPPKGASRPGAAGLPGASGTARVPPEILAYARALDEKVRANWTVPELAQKEAEKLMVQVRITIEKDGRVSKVRMEKVSGNPYFDDSVRRAIQKASPLPVPPQQLRGEEDYYEVGFRFYGEGGNT
ncbi:MAG TPA: cell envelope integrity protein TolA [Candidatus Deferrimicrobiaceae bacterium]